MVIKKAPVKAKKRRSRKIDCAYAIIVRGAGYVFIERLTEPRGIALVGGQRQNGEFPFDCIVREGETGTGTAFSVHRALGIFNDGGGDLQDSSLMIVFVVSALGVLRGEPGKTRILELTPKEIHERKEEFVSNHFKIVDYFLAGGGMSPEEEAKCRTRSDLSTRISPKTQKTKRG